MKGYVSSSIVDRRTRGVRCLDGAIGGEPHGERPGKPSDDRLSKDDHELLAVAARSGQSSVTLLIAAKGGAAKQVVNGVQALGGIVGYRDDDSVHPGRVPTGEGRAVALVAGDPGGRPRRDHPARQTRADGAVARRRRPRRAPRTPRNNPYMPIGDTGAAQFIAAHPTWDGRGVTVGILDTRRHLDHPAC